MKYCFALFFCLFVFSCTIICAQTPVVEWHKTYGGPNGDYAHSIEPTKDGGYIVAGYVESGGGDIIGYHGNTGINDIWVIKLNSAGKMEWQKCLGGTWLELGAYIHQTADGGYILAASSASANCTVTGNHGGTDYWVVKLTATGDITWQKQYGGSNNEYAYSIDITGDGGYVVTGQTESSDGDVSVNHGMTDYWVIKIGPTGNLEWQKSCGGSADDISRSVKSTTDGGCIVTGFTGSADGDVTGNHGIRDYWVVKLDHFGNIQWAKSLGGSAYDECWSVDVTADGGYILNGLSGSNDGDVSGNHHTVFSGASSDMWVVKLNSSGNIQWQKCYGGTKNETGYYITATGDGGYVFCGSSDSDDGDAVCNKYIDDMLIVKISSNGTVEWTKSLGGDYYDFAFSVRPLSNGGFIVAGETCSKDVTGFHPQTNEGTCSDYWVIKLSPPVTTPPSPAVTILPASGNVCAGTSNTFTAMANYAGTNAAYQWSVNGIPGGSNSPVFTSPFFNNNDVVTCTVTPGGECNGNTLPASATITVKSNATTINPSIAITASSTSICSCTAVSFKAAVINPGPTPVYQWKVNGIVTDNSTDSYLTKDLFPGDKISCILMDTTACIANGFVASNDIIMNDGTGAAPTVSITASAVTICVGEPVTFTASTTNAGSNPAFNWKVNGINAGTNSSTFTSTTISDGDKIDCSITIDPLYACVNILNANANTIQMIVTAKLTPAVVIQTASTLICKGAVATFNARASNAGSSVTYQWKVNGINTGTNAAVFSTASLNDGDAVSCTITVDPLFVCANAATAASNSIVMVVNTAVPPSVNITANRNDVCPGTEITFTAAAENAGPSPSYQWMVNAVAINNTAAVFSSKTLVNGDAVSCSVIPGAGTCSPAAVVSNTIVALLNPLPVIVHFSPGDTTIKTGDRVQFTSVVSANTISYTWSPAGKLENTNTLNPRSLDLLENTSFTLEAVSDKGCKASAVAVVKVGIPLNMPLAFSPNNDGINDVFRIPPGVLLQLKEFSIFDRWGNSVFKTSDINAGWNGTLRGVKLNPGNYIYFISGEDHKGKVFVRGNVLLVK